MAYILLNDTICDVADQTDHPFSGVCISRNIEIAPHNSVFVLSKTNLLSLFLEMCNGISQISTNFASSDLARNCFFPTFPNYLLREPS